MASFAGADLVVTVADEYDHELFLDAAKLDPVIEKHQQYLAEWAYVTPEIRRTLPDEDDLCYVEDKTMQNSASQIAIFGLSPSEQIDSDSNAEYTSNEYQGMTQQLYTARGDQGMGLSSAVASTNNIVLDEETFDSLLKTYCTRTEKQLLRRKKAYQLKRTLFTIKSTPSFLKHQGTWMIVSHPQYSFLSGKSIDKLPISNVMLWLNDSVKHDRAVIDMISDDFADVLFDEGQIRKAYQQEESTQEVLKIIDIIFYVTIAIIMFLCFFSLVASMTANMLNQSKEIGVMRSIGITSYRIKIMYFYEALMLVLSSCLLGIVIGMTVGYTMALQQNMFLNTKMQVFFPWQQVLQITGLSILCAFFSTQGPATQILRKQIAEILRL